MEMTTEKMNKLLALNDEQKALLAELKTLGEKMKKANLIILFDSFEISFAALNGENIEDFAEEDFADEEYVEMSSWCENWGNVDIPNDFEFRSSFGNPYILFKDPIVTDLHNHRQMQQSMDSALL